MGAMAAQTVYGQIRVALILVVVAYGMGGMLLPIMATGAYLINRGVIKEKHLVCRMGGMAGCTHALCNGRMFVLNCLQPLHGVAMALGADLGHRLFKQGILCRGVGGMAVQAAHAVKHRPVDPVLVQVFIDHIAMAAQAEFMALRLSFEGLGFSGPVVAALTHLLAKGYMHLVVEQPLFV